MGTYAQRFAELTKILLASIVAALMIAVVGASTATAQNVDWLINIDDVGFDPAPAGSDIEYAIGVVNNGFDAAPANTISIDIPVNTTFISATGTISGCVSVPLSGVGPATVTCNVPALPSLGAESVVMTIQSAVEGALAITATVPVTVGGVTDSNAGNNVEPETTTILKGSDIGVTLTAPATAAAGSTIPLVFDAINNGPNIANNFDLSFPIPAGIVITSTPAGCVLSGAVYTCTVTGPVAVGATVSLPFTGQVSAAAGSTITPTGSVLNSDPGDPIASNNTDLANIAVTPGTDVSITKSLSPSGTLLVGDAVTFTLGAQYTGDSPTGLTITDTLPAAYTIDAVTAPGWACAVAGQTVTCTRASGAGAGADVSLGAVTIDATIVAAGGPENIATISSDSPTDPDLSNNTASDGGALIAIPFVDLSAAKTGPVPALAVIGNTYDFSISAANLGNAGYIGDVVLVDHVPTGLTLTSVVLNGWTCTALPAVGPTDVTCTRTYTAIAPLAAGSTTPNVDFSGEFTQSGSVVNGVTVSTVGGNYGDSNAANDDATYGVAVVVAGNAADIGTSKSALVPVVVVGEVQTFILEITNSGPNTSNNVQISDTLNGLLNSSVGPTGSGYISEVIAPGLATGGTCSTAAAGATSRQLSCNFTTIPVCTAGVDCPTITIQIRPGGNGGAQTNTFNAISSVTPDLDLGNNTATAAFSVDARADVTVFKTATPDPVSAGQNLTYVITASNIANGLSEADAVTITDTLPNDMVFLSAVPSAGACGTMPVSGSTTSAVNNQIVCNLGTIANGGQQTVTVIVRPKFGLIAQTITNNVDVVTSTTEIDLLNNSASVAVDVIVPDVDILINKSDSIDPLPIGDDTVYTLTVTNNGPSASENVEITDMMPPTRISYQSHVVSGGGVCSTVPVVNSLGGTLICSWPYLEAGASETILVTARGVAKGSTTNTATIDSDEITAGYDRVAGNNSTTETTTVRTKSDVEVSSKVATPASVALNDNFNYVITVHVNTGVGLAEADDVVLSDSLPANMALTGAPVAVVTAGTASSTACTGVSGGTSFSCDLGTVSLNGTVEITVPVEVTSVTANPQVFTNTATVSTSSYESPANTANNINTGDVSVTSSSIAGFVFRDFADDSAITAGDTFVGGIPLVLTGTTFDGTAVSISTTTNAGGDYLFPFLAAGTYTVTRGVVGEAYLTDGTNTAGSEGGTVSSATVISAIALPATTDAVDYLFPLIPQARVGIAKQVSGAVTVNPDGSFNTTFDLVVENFSLEALDNMVVTDPLAGAAPLFGATYQALGTPATDPMAAGNYTMLSAPSGSCGGIVAGYNGLATEVIATGFTLASGATCTLSISIRVQPTVPLPPVLASGGRYENQATVTGEGVLSGQTSATNPELSDTSDDGTNPDPTGNGVASDASEGDPTPVLPVIDPAIALVKTADVSALSVPPVAGETITYTFAVTNTGNVNLTGVTVADPMPGLVFAGGPIAALAVGATDSSITATYLLTQADVDAGQVQNTATTQGTDPYGTVVNDTSGTDVANDTPTTTLIAQTPSIALIKASDASLVNSPAQLGDIVTYTFTLENTGNVTLTNVGLTDALAGIVLVGGPIPSMAPGDIDTATFTASYALQQSDIDAGVVSNTATATGTPPTGPNVSDVSGTNNTNDTATTDPLVQDPSIALIKTADVSALQAPPQAGDIITYGFTVENTGNVTLTNVTLTDALAGIVLVGGPIPTMAPGDIDGVTFTATYALTLADMDAGLVSNTATATGTPPTGPNVSDVSGTDNTNDTPTDVALTPAPSIALIKTADVSALQAPPQAGDIITYGFTVENTGNVTLTNVTLTDALAGIVLVGGPIPTMAPGDIDGVTFTATYALTLADMDAGLVSNTATATGTPPTGPNVSDVSGTDNTNDTPTDVNLTPAPSIALIKTADVSALQAPPQAGDIITYGFTVENTGNVTLTNVTLTDALAGIVLTGGPIPSMDPGDIDTATFTATYALTQADVDAGIVSNTATATGTPPTGPNVTDTSGTTNTNDTPTDVTLAAAPSIALIKTADVSALQVPPQAGDVITYGFTVENTGNMTLTNVTLTDALAGIVLVGGPIPTMAPGDIDAVTFTATYTLTLADMAAGEVSNTAIATGTPPTGPNVTDTSGTTNTNDTPTLTPITQEPAIVLQKFVDAAPHLAGSVVGDLVEYTFTVTNTGNIPLNNVMITDALAGVTVSGGPIPVLNPGVVDTLTFTATYNLIPADISAGEVINNATVTGDWGPGNTLQVSDVDSVRLEVGKIEAISELYPPFATDGGTTTTMLASDLLNNAPATLATVNITVVSTDPALTLDPATGLITLAPGNPAGPYVVTYQICSIAVPTLCDTTTETVTQGALPGIETVKTQVFTDNGDGRDDVGDTVTYTITVTNTGNTPLSSVALVDTLTDSTGAALTLTTGPSFVSASAGSPEGTLEIAEVATYTATFVLDLQAVNAGGVSNTVTASGMPVYGAGVPGVPSLVSDVSDDGIDTDGNMVDDPTVLALAASPVVSGLSMTKTTPREIVRRGSVVPYTITIDNTATHVAGPYNIVDTLPPGLIYVPNTATLDGAAAVVSVSGAVITWSGVTVPASGQVVVTLDARVLSGASHGALVNRVNLMDPATGDSVLREATAMVRIMPEAVFDCTDVIGKVFNDANGNGYQDANSVAPHSAAITDQTYYGGKGGKLVAIPPQADAIDESGIPGVRLVTVDGLVITTDEHGRYSVPCAALPAGGAGDNFIIKVDPRSLPSGFSMTTENPRVARVTAGMMSEINFGATLGHLARVDINNAAFTAAGQPNAALQSGVAQLATRLVDNPATVVIAYHVSATATAAEVGIARQRLEALKDQMRQEWRHVGRGHLNIQTQIMREDV